MSKQKLIPMNKQT